MATEAESALGVLTGLLDEWGLASLADWAWNQLTAGNSSEQIVVELRRRPEYKSRFAANAQRSAKGLTPLSEAEYLAYERQARQIMRANGLPEGFYDQPDDFNALIANDVSIAEAQQRIDDARQIVFEDPPEARAEFARLYGIEEGDLLAHALDPDRAAPLIERRIQAARVAGAAQRTGVGALTAEQAERIAAGTSSIEQAQQGLAAVAGLGELRQRLPGERAGEEVTTDEAIAAAFEGNVEAQRRIRRRQRQRAAEFDRGGGFVGSVSAGAVGAGSANAY